MSMASSVTTASGLSGPPIGGRQFDHVETDLDESFYVLQEDEQDFLAAQTGINDPVKLKQHVLQMDSM